MGRWCGVADGSGFRLDGAATGRRSLVLAAALTRSVSDAGGVRAAKAAVYCAVVFPVGAGICAAYACDGCRGQPAVWSQNTARTA
ncbi:hypothetical protein D3C87_1388880 [compost metagenome]